MILKRLVAGVAITAALGIGYSIKPLPAHQGWVNLHQSEDLSDAPILEPISIIAAQYSAGSVCYATDKTHQDINQYYVDCAEYLNAGGKIAPAH